MKILVLYDFLYKGQYSNSERKKSSIY